ncbi:hypothetical protein POBR111598_10005 [Polynucleobacter brandtiae]
MAVPLLANQVAWVLVGRLVMVIGAVVAVVADTLEAAPEEATHHSPTISLGVVAVVAVVALHMPIV